MAGVMVGTGGVDWNLALTHTFLAIRKNLIDNISVGHPVLDTFKRKGAVATYGGGQDANGNMAIIVPLLNELSPNTKYLGNKYDKIEVKPVDGVSAATFRPKLLTDSVVISMVDEVVNAGEFKNIDLLETKKLQTTLKMGEEIEKGLVYSSMDNAPGDNLRTIINAYGAAGATYTGDKCGDIDCSTTNTWWRNKAIHWGSAPCSGMTDFYAHMNKMLLLIRKEGIGDPDLWIMDAIAFERYQKEMFAKTTFQATGRLTKGDLSYPVMAFGGAEVIMGPYVTSPVTAGKGVAYAVNTKTTKYTVVKEFNMKLRPFREAENQLIRVGSWVHGYCMSSTMRRGNGVVTDVEPA